MCRAAVLLMLLVLSACNAEEADDVLSEKAVALCQTAVKMSVPQGHTVKLLTSFNATKLREQMPHEARTGLAQAPHVIGVTFASTAHDSHHDGQAYCGFEGTEDDLHLAHVLIDGRALDTFTIDTVRERFLNGQVGTHEQF